MFRNPSATPAASARILSCHIHSDRASELEVIIQLAEIAVVGKKIRSNFYGLAGVLHEEVSLAQWQLGTERMIGVPLCLSAPVSSSKMYGEGYVYQLGQGKGGNVE